MFFDAKLELSGYRYGRHSLLVFPLCVAFSAALSQTQYIYQTFSIKLTQNVDHAVYKIHARSKLKINTKLN